MGRLTDLHTVKIAQDGKGPRKLHVEVSLHVSTESSGFRRTALGLDAVFAHDYAGIPRNSN